MIHGRATGITAYLENGGTLDHAQQIAAHESPRTTKLYDRTTDRVSLDEIERIAISGIRSVQHVVFAIRIARHLRVVGDRLLARLRGVVRATVDMFAACLRIANLVRDPRVVEQRATHVERHFRIVAHEQEVGLQLRSSHPVP
jgi:hypothetical protein